MATKHLEAFQRREECRASLLELRRSAREKERAAALLAEELTALRKLEARERARLVELTSQVVQLIHADSTGLLAKASNAAGDDELAEVVPPAPAQ